MPQDTPTQPPSADDYPEIGLPDADAQRSLTDILAKDPTATPTARLLAHISERQLAMSEMLQQNNSLLVALLEREDRIVDALVDARDDLDTVLTHLGLQKAQERPNLRLIRLVSRRRD